MQNDYYYSYSKDSYPFPKLKRNGLIVETFFFRCGTGIKEQTLTPGESVIFSVPKSEMTYEMTEDSRRETNQPTQVGFPIHIGEAGFLDREIKKKHIFGVKK